MKNTHIITLRVDNDLYEFLNSYTNNISSSIRTLLQLALECDYCAIFDPNYRVSNTTIKYKLSTKVDPFINDMIVEYSSINDISKSETIKRLIEIVLDCEGLK